MNRIGNARKTVYIPMFASVIAACSWITVPASIPFTMQTFGIFLTLILLGGKIGTVTLLVYILTGAVGLPVFHGFSGGLGILMGNTGGYFAGFVLMGLVYWAAMSIGKDRTLFKFLGLLMGILLCYAAGTLWFAVLYTGELTYSSIITSLSACVIPFVIPDGLKMMLAFYMAGKIEKHMGKLYL